MRFLELPSLFSLSGVILEGDLEEKVSLKLANFPYGRSENV